MEGRTADGPISECLVAQAGCAPVVRTVNPNQSAAKKCFDQGTNLLHRGRHAEAETCLRDSLRLKPDDADTLNNLGTAIWEQGRASEAMAYYLRAYQLKPKDFSILNNLGIVLWDQNKPDRAVTYYRRALELWPESFDAQMNLGVALSDLGEFDEALVWMRSSLKIRPDSADAWDNVGMTLARQGKWDEAMACYDRAIELKPDFGEAHRNRALGYLTLGDLRADLPSASGGSAAGARRASPFCAHPGPESPSKGARSFCTMSKGWATPCNTFGSRPRSSSAAGGCGCSARRRSCDCSRFVLTSIGSSMLERRSLIFTSTLPF